MTKSLSSALRGSTGTCNVPTCQGRFPGSVISRQYHNTLNTREDLT